MSVANLIKTVTSKAILDLYGISIDDQSILVNATKDDFQGDYTVVLFALVKQLKMSPEVLGNELGNWILNHEPKLFKNYHIIKGFLNLSIADDYWLEFLQKAIENKNYGQNPPTRKKIVLEYSSPNTNKPLHLGHLRNNFLGRSIAEILMAAGNEVNTTCIVNDRGIHICKSMIAWQLFGNGATPNQSATKGDHFVGDFYVKFNQAYQEEVAELMKGGMDKELAEKEAPIMKATQKMLLDWEAGDPAVMDLWRRMNEWVYSGFNQTYARIGSQFDKTYYESQTYLLGKDLVEAGLKQGVFYQKPDGSVWIDLTEEGLDEKVVRRKDGTSVYITQDIGLAQQRQKEFQADSSIYVVGDEQNYHFKVLKLICQKLGMPAADAIYHLSYGMVELPTGKMKSREGTVVDADDLMDEMVAIAKSKTEELGKVKDFSEAELAELYNTIGLGALKFFLLRVDPKKRMVFNPEESIDFHGFTGPFIQYTHARIKSILRKLNPEELTSLSKLSQTEWLKLEKDLALHLETFSTVIKDSAADQNPSLIAIYLFNLAKLFNSFYTEHSITQAETPEKKALRIQLAILTARVISKGMKLLGMEVPERM